MNCTSIAKAGLTVRLFDAEHGTPLPITCDDQITIVDGEHAQDLTSLPRSFCARSPMAIPGAIERPGTYTLTVRKAGFEDYLKRNIEVGWDGCHVVGERIDVRLERK